MLEERERLQSVKVENTVVRQTDDLTLVRLGQGCGESGGLWH